MSAIRVKARFAEGEEVPTVTDQWVGSQLDGARSLSTCSAYALPVIPTCGAFCFRTNGRDIPLRKDYDVQLQDSVWVHKNLGIESGQ